jgi:hypothetical protein
MAGVDEQGHSRTGCASIEAQVRVRPSPYSQGSSAGARNTAPQHKSHLLTTPFRTGSERKCGLLGDPFGLMVGYCDYDRG